MSHKVNGDIMNEKKVEHQRKYWEGERERRPPEHPVIEAFVSPKINYIRDYVDLSKNTKLLDVGCGNGFFTYYFSKFADTIGLDYSRYMLSINPCNTLVQGSALSLPFKNETFDFVFCSDLLHHVKAPTIVVREMTRVSKKYVVLSEPNRNNPLMGLFSAVIPEERGALKFSLKYMERLVEFLGLKIIDSCSMGSIVPNKTPLSLLKYFKKVDCKAPFMLCNVVISHK